MVAAARVRRYIGDEFIARAGSAAKSTALPREQALKILNAYLEATRFANVHINKDYLVSLGLSVP